jgi:hypothetical protein
MTWKEEEEKYFYILRYSKLHEYFITTIVNSSDPTKQSIHGRYIEEVTRTRRILNVLFAAYALLT